MDNLAAVELPADSELFELTDEDVDLEMEMDELDIAELDISDMGGVMELGVDGGDGESSRLDDDDEDLELDFESFDEDDSNDIDVDMS